MRAHAYDIIWTEGEVLRKLRGMSQQIFWSTALFLLLVIFPTYFARASSQPFQNVPSYGAISYPTTEIIFQEDFEAGDALNSWYMFGKGTGWTVERTTERVLDGLASSLLTSSPEIYDMAGINRPSPLIFDTVGAELDFQLGDEGPICIEVALELQTGTEMIQASFRWVQDPYFPEGMWQYWNDGWHDAMSMSLTRGLGTKHNVKVVADHKNEKYGYINCDGEIIDLRGFTFSKIPKERPPATWISLMVWSQGDTPVTLVVDDVLFTKGESITFP